MARHLSEVQDTTPAPQANDSILEQFARQVVDDVMPTDAQAAPEGAGALPPIQDILAMVISIFTTIVKMCPASATSIAKSLKNPNIRQRAALFSACHEQSGGFRIFQAADLYRSMLTRGGAASDTDALALVKAAKDPVNLLI